MGMRKTVRPQLPAASAGILLLLLLVCATSVDGAALFLPDPCPDGVAAGETWIPTVSPFPDKSDKCTKCVCFRNGYSCYSCGLAVIQPQPSCHVIKASPEQPYPDCCNIKQVCPGDNGYNATLADK